MYPGNFLLRPRQGGRRSHDPLAQLPRAFELVAGIKYLVEQTPGAFRSRPIDLGLLPPDKRGSAFERGFAAVKALPALRQHDARPLDGLQRAFFPAYGRSTELLGELVQPRFALISPALALLQPRIAPVSLALTLVGDLLALVSLALTLIGDLLALVSLALTLVGDLTATVMARSIR
jgi:hypothetical protein